MSYGLTRAHEYEDEILLLKARAERAEAQIEELKKLSSHGNGEILLGWMDAHKKAMDRLEKAEAERDVMAKRMMDISKEFVVISEHNIALKRRLDTVEAENAQLKAWLDAVTDFNYYEEDHLEAKHQYEKWRKGQKNG
jgi:chromosome segregation ATPase